jgi:hypothetical protein
MFSMEENESLSLIFFEHQCNERRDLVWLAVLIVF